MTGKLQKFSIKLLATTLAVIMAVPLDAQAISSKDNDKSYAAHTSVMGVQEEDIDGQRNTRNETSLLKSGISTEESSDYIIEKSASLSKTTGEVNYKIVVKNKNPESVFKDSQLATFAITENTYDQGLEIDKVHALDKNGNETELEYKENSTNLLTNTDSIESLGITTNNTQYGLVYYIKTRLTDQAYSNLGNSSPQLSLDLTFIGGNQEIIQTRYALDILKDNKTEISVAGDTKLINEDEQLLEKQDNAHLYKGEYKKEEKKIFNSNPAQLVWTDFINPTNGENYKVNLNLDENQDTTDSQIKIDYYQAKDNGYILNQSFSQTIDYTDNINLQIPQGYLARLELTTKVKENTNPREFEFNGIKIPNPSFEEKTEEDEKSAEDSDPLPNNFSESNKELKTSNDSITGQDDLDFSSNSKNKKEESDSDNISLQKIELNSSNDIIAEQDDLDFSQNSKSKNIGNSTSAIGLNKDAYISKLQADDELTSELEKATNQLAQLLESYSKDEISQEDLKNKLNDIYESEKIDAKQIRDIISALIAGLSEDKYKAASLDPTKLVYEAIERAQVETAVAGPDAKLPEKTPAKLAADKLQEKGVTIEDFQNYMYELEEKYNLTNEDADKIYTENAEAIQKLIEKYREENTIAEARNNFAVLDGGFSNERFITDLQYITTQLSSAENESKLKSLAKEYYNDNNAIDIIRNKYVGWKINLPGKEELGRDIQELKTSGKYDFNALDFSLYAPAGQSLANYKVVIEDAGNGNVLSKGIMTETGTMMTYGTSISKSSLPDAGLNIYVIAEAPVKRKEYNVGLKVSPDQNYVMALKDSFEDKFEELKKRYPLLIKYINTDQSEPYKNGINLIDTRMVFKEPAKGQYQQMSNTTPFLSTEYNDNNTDTNTKNGKNRLSVFGNLDHNGALTWIVSELITLETLENKSSIGRDAYTAKSNGKQVSPEAQLLIPKGNSYEVKNLGSVSQTNLASQLPDIPGTIVNYTYKDSASDVYSENTFRLSSGKTATIQLKKIEEGASYTNQDTINHSKRIHDQRDGKFYEQVLDLKNIMRAFIPEDKSISKNERFKDPGVINTGVMVWCLTYGKGDPSKARGFSELLTKKQLDANNPVESGKLIYKGMFTPKGETSTLHKANMTDDDYAKVFEYMQRIFWYAEQMRNEKKLDEKTFSQIVQYNIYHFTSNRGETWYKGDVANAGGSVKNMTEQEHNLAIELKNRVTNAEGWSSVDRINDVHVVLYSHNKDKYQQVISGDVHSKSTPKGSVSIKKIDSDTNKTISNVGFKLTSVKDGKTYSGNTDSNGTLSFNELPLGEYTLEETSAPSGYVLEKGKRTIFITAENADQALSVSYYNKKSKIEFIKVDENNQIIPGATFELKQNGRTLTGYDKSADSTGKFGWTGLKQGTYEVFEKSLPSGYENYKDNLGKKVAEFTIDDQNNVSAIKNLTNSLNNKSNIIINKASYGNFKIKKVDQDKKTISKVGFTLYTNKDDSNSAVKYNDQTEFFTNRDGYLYFSNLPNGTYYLKETTIPAGYTIKDSEWTVVTVKDGQVTISDSESTTSQPVTNTEKIVISNTKPNDAEAMVEYEIVNIKTPKGRFRVEKVNESNDPLDGVKFELTGPNSFKEEKTTDISGTIEFTNLNPGDYKLVESEAKAGYVATKKTWNINVSESDGLVTIKENNKLFGQSDLSDMINLSKAYAAEADETINIAFVVENLRGKSEGVVEEYNKNINEIKNSLAQAYGDKATITLVANGHNAGQQIIYENVPATSDIDLSLKQFDEGGGNSHLDEAIDRVKTAFDKKSASENYVVIMQSGKGDEYVDDYYYDTSKGFFTPENDITSVVMYVEDSSADISKYIKSNENGSLINDENSIIVGNTDQNSVLERLYKKLPIFEIDEQTTDSNISEAQRTDLDDRNKLNSDGYIITNSSEYQGSDISVIKVVNKKPTYPSTGGSGTFIGFALLGTAVMLAAIAYYGIYANNKNSRRAW